MEGRLFKREARRREWVVMLVGICGPLRLPVHLPWGVLDESLMASAPGVCGCVATMQHQPGIRECQGASAEDQDMVAAVKGRSIA